MHMPAVLFGHTHMPAVLFGHTHIIIVLIRTIHMDKNRENLMTMIPIQKSIHESFIGRISQ